MDAQAVEEGIDNGPPVSELPSQLFHDLHPLKCFIFKCINDSETDRKTRERKERGAVCVSPFT